MNSISQIAISIIVAIIVAVFSDYLRRRPNKSKLVVDRVTETNQDNDPEIYEPKVIDVIRLTVRNKGEYQAHSVEAYLEQVIDNGEVRKDFIPMPLTWTHTVDEKTRNIFPNQTVLLDFLYNNLDPEFASDRSVHFALATGRNVVTLSQLCVGESELKLSLYQESGQVVKVKLRVSWDTKSVPKVILI